MIEPTKWPILENSLIIPQAAPGETGGEATSPNNEERVSPPLNNEERVSPPLADQTTVTNAMVNDLANEEIITNGLEETM